LKELPKQRKPAHREAEGQENREDPAPSPAAPEPPEAFEDDDGDWES